VICFVFKPSRIVDGQREERKCYSGKLKLDTWAKPKVFALETTDRRIAEMKLRELAKDFEKEALGLTPARTVREALNRPLTGLLSEFAADLQAKGRTKGTLRKYQGTLKVLFKRLGWTDLRSVNAKTFVQWRAKSGLSPKSVNDVLANAQGFFRWLRDQRQLVEDPLAYVQRIDTRGRAPCRRALSPVEFGKLLRTAPFHRAVVYATALYTGLRRKELNEVRWMDFLLDEPNPRVRVPASISKNRREATLPLHPELAATLLRLRPAAFDPLSKPFHHHVPRIETVRKDMEQAGIPLRDDLGRRVDFHSLRMTFGTTLLASGVHPIVVKELMRHSDLKLTTNLYNDSSQLPLAQGVAILPSIAGKFEPERRAPTHTETHTREAHKPAVANLPINTAAKAGEKELTSPEIPKTFISNTPKFQSPLFVRTSKRTQNHAQTGVGAGHDPSSAVATGLPGSTLQPSVSVAVRRDSKRPGANFRVG
jgi:integrase